MLHIRNPVVNFLSNRKLISFCLLIEVVWMIYGNCLVYSVAIDICKDQEMEIYLVWYLMSAEIALGYLFFFKILF